MVTFDPLTRRVTMVQRTWPVPDSLSWARARDSVASRLDDSGGQRIVCLAGVPLEHLLYNQLWRFPGHDVRLVAYRWRPPQVPPEWMLQVDAFAGAAPECELGGEPLASR